MSRNRTYPTVLFALCFGIFSLLQMPLAAARAGIPNPLPDHLKSADLDWVCVTDAALVEAYAPLAAHRQEQGLAAVVLTLEDVLFWSPHTDDPVAALRWLADQAARQWGASYLLLGGSHAVLPAPLHHLDFDLTNYTHPTDAYYACLDGQWDLDQDGLFAEYADDAADPTVHLAVGRLPVDTAAEVAAAVAKIIAFELRPLPRQENALFAASLMDILYEPGDMYPSPALAAAMALADSVRIWRPQLRLGTLFEGPDAVDPLDDPLNIFALMDSLASRTHDLVYFQLEGIDTAWELARSSLVNGHQVSNLVDCGHTFLGAMLSGPVADSRDVPSQLCLIPELLGASGGGAVAMCAPTGMGYLYPSRVYQNLLWRRLTDEATLRLGDAHRGALQAFLTAIPASSPVLSTYWYQSVQGDPATLLRPVAGAAPVPPSVVRAEGLRAVPNPFNPVTEIRFEVTGPAGVEQPVRVEIYDLQGRLVTVLLDRSLPPGPRAVPWQADAPSGLYFAKVSVAGRKAAVKLTLVE